MNSTPYQASEAFARALDETDPLARFRGEFLFPKDVIYLCGNSLGLQPKAVREMIAAELDDWRDLAVEGHSRARHPWTPYHENLTPAVSRMVGALPEEVVTMNTLSVNLHLMMVSFYQPTKTRYRILTEAGAFPSDQYAVVSQALFHSYAQGFNPADAILELKPREGERTLRHEDILKVIEREGKSIALIMLGNVNYLTGQAFDMKAIATAGHRQGCRVGFDLAHAAGNLELSLHDSGVDFAVWCNYKYINAGPGAIAGCFVHERHVKDASLPKFTGWWGHDKALRFKMEQEFVPIPTAESWQLSNPPIFQLAALRASMDLFDQATIGALRKKSEKLTGYLEFLLKQSPHPLFKIITPSQASERGCQLSLEVGVDGKMLLGKLRQAGVVGDFREPNIIRVAPAPLYNSFTDVFRFSKIFSETLAASASSGR
jgi:kynureninase